MWNGGRGYRTSASHALLLYVRTRHYSPIESRWCSTDLRWPHESAFAYANGNPTTLSDPTGMSTSVPCIPDQFSGDIGDYRTGWTRTGPDGEYDFFVYRPAEFAVTTKCPPGKSKCTKLCQFKQEVRGQLCQNYRLIAEKSSADWIDDSPDTPVIWTCGNQTGSCYKKINYFDAPGAYNHQSLRVYQWCPLSLDASGTPAVKTALPFEWNFQYRSWAVCGGVQTSKYYWYVRFKVYLDNANTLRMEVGNPTFSDCAY